jgi:hypothetical protein
MLERVDALLELDDPFVERIDFAEGVGGLVKLCLEEVESPYQHPQRQGDEVTDCILAGVREP